MANFFSTAGEFKPDSLIADTSFPVQTGSVKLGKDQGVLLRGTVVGKDATQNNVFVPVDSTKNIVPFGILTDDTDTTGADIVAIVYTSGPFNRNALIFGGTDKAETHEEVLREKGIYLKAVL